MSIVFFFGGYRSTKEQVERWRKSAQVQHPELDYRVFAWPGGPASKPMSHWHATESVVAQLTVDPAQHWLVGHSSGAGIANDIAEAADHHGLHNFHLVVLDGFVPDKLLQQLLNLRFQCWSARSGPYHSLNYGALQGAQNFHVYHPDHRVFGWALHFSLVNKNVRDISGIDDGYDNCDANLCWLTPPVAEV